MNYCCADFEDVFESRLMGMERFDDGDYGLTIEIPIYKGLYSDLYKGKDITVIVFHYCPFCGQKLESKDPVDEAIKLVKKVKEKRDDE